MDMMSFNKRMVQSCSRIKMKSFIVSKLKVKYKELGVIKLINQWKKPVRVCIRNNL